MTGAGGVTSKTNQVDAFHDERGSGEWRVEGAATMSSLIHL